MWPVSGSSYPRGDAISDAEGLDSFMAEAVVMKLRVLAESGRTVVATIHQPSSQVLLLR